MCVHGATEAIIAANGSHICSTDADFLGVAARLVLEAHMAAA